MTNKVSYSGTRKVFAFANLHMSANWSLKQAEALAADGGAAARYPSMMCVIASAFLVEAALNHIGAAKVPHWDVIERKLQPREKLKILAPLLGITPDFGERPFQSLKTLLVTRNALAHGKTEIVEGDFEAEVDAGNLHTHLPANWETECTPARARILFDDADAIVVDLFERAGLMSQFGLVSDMDFDEKP